MRSWSNCIKLTIEGRFIGYFPDLITAHTILQLWRKAYYEISYQDKVVFKIEPWFIANQ